MNRRIRFHLLFTVFAMASMAAASDTIYLRAGEQESGLLEKMTPDTVVFKGVDGEKTIPKADITSIQLQQPRMFDEIQKADQITDPDLKECIEKQPDEKAYPADGSVTLLQRKTFDLSEAEVVKETNRFIIKVLRQRGEDAGSVNVWHFEDTDIPQVDFALTVTPDGRVLHLSDSALKTESIYTNLPAYRRLSRIRFACKEPRPGSILDVQYTVVRKRDPLLEPLYGEETFRDDSPIIRKEVRFILPKGGDAAASAAVNYAIGAPDAGLVTVAAPSAGELVLSLSQPQPGLIPEPLMPPLRNFAPTITFAVPGTWESISKGFAAELDKVAPLSDSLKAKAAELAKAGGARAIYNYVARGIRTVPVAHLKFRMTPHSPDETVQRGAANELDKNFLYFRMLEAAGVECTFALVRDRALGRIADTVPSLRAFNRSAVYLVREKRFSNAASDLVPYDTLAGDLQGPGGDLQNVPALLITSIGSELTRTQPPSLAAEAQTDRFEAVLSEDGALELSVTYTGAGNGAVGFRTLKDLDEQQFRNQMEQLVGGIHPAAQLKDYKISDLADLDVAPELTVKCSIPGYAVKAGGLMLFNLPVVDYDAGDVGRPSREQDLCWPRVARGICEGTITLPKGFKVYSMAKGVKFNTASVRYQAKLKSRKNQIEFKDQSDVKLQEAPKEAYAGYKRFKELRAGFSRQRIILTQE